MGTTQPTATVFEFLNEAILEARHLEPGARGTDLHLPGTEELTGRVKVYVSGGENKMHSHPKEDHVFYVLSGQATFHLERDDNAVDVAANSGVVLPRGTKYWFTNTGEGNLVLLRVGSGQHSLYRLDANGKEIPDSSEGWGHVEGHALV